MKSATLNSIDTVLPSEAMACTANRSSSPYLVDPGQWRLESHSSAVAQPLGDDHIQAGADHLRGAMPEDALGAPVPVADHAFMVEDYDAVGAPVAICCTSSVSELSTSSSPTSPVAYLTN